MSNLAIKFSLGAAAALLCVSLAAAAEPPAGPPNLSKAQREKMAQIHEQMAQCLRSDRTMAECHQQMMDDCRAALGDKSCGMMGHHRGMRPRHPMMATPNAAPPAQP